MASSSSRKILNPSGLASFRRMIQAELPSLGQSPILVISSEPSPSPSSSSSSSASNQPSLSNVHDACQLVQFTLAQQFGLRTVPSTVSSAVCSLQDVEQRLELLRRTGAAHVVAVGSGAAMDLAKALPYEKNDIEQVILVPSTYAAVLAANTSHSLLLDPVEETLVPLPNPNNNHQHTTKNATIQMGDSSVHTAPFTTTTIAPLDAKYMAPVVDPLHVWYASLALILDACYRQSNHPHLPNLIQTVHNLLDENENEHDIHNLFVLSHDQIMELLCQAGELVSYGLGDLSNNQDRSIPVALAASLIPQIFPHVHPLTFYASLVPGLCHAINNTNMKDGDGEVQRLVDRLLLLSAQAQTASSLSPTLTVTDEQFKGFSVPDMALSHIHTNQTVWQALDVPDQVLTEILQHGIEP